MTNGIKFPLTVVNGNLAVTSEGDLYKGHILSWLKTLPKERVMVPQYGMQDYLFQTIPNISYITTTVKEGLQQYIPEVSFEVQGAISDTGEVELYIYWSYGGDESTLKVTL